MYYSRIIELVAALVVIGALVGANLLDGPMRRVRPTPMTARGDGHADPSAVQPTMLMASLGPIRGLAINFLWLRSDQLKQEGKLFEANHLSQMITTLMPRYPEVWAYHSWDLAYNISVLTHTREERWDWVNKGISLLRDRGLVINPKASKLYRQLSWMYLHKVGLMADDMHWYYKQQMAQQWQELLGDVPPGATTQEVVSAFRAIADAPQDLAQLKKLSPAISTLLTWIKRLNYDLDEVLLRQIGRARMLGPTIRADAETALTPAAGAEPAKSDYDPHLADLLSNPTVGQAVGPLLAYLRKKVLRENYHMDPRFMLNLMEEYGPMDWRHPAAHAAYWAAKGLRETGGPDSQKDITGLNMNRQVIHAFQQLRRFGRLSYDPVTGSLDMQPDTRYIAAYERSMDQTRQRIASGRFGDVTMDSFEDAHENFLLEAICLHYLYGDHEEAQRLYKKARRLYGRKAANKASGQYTVPLVELVARQLRRDIEAMSTANEFIRALLIRAFIEGLAAGRLSVYSQYIEVARQVHRRYQQDKDSQPTNDQDRMKLLPFPDVVTESYVQYMGYLHQDMDVLVRSRIWANTPETLRRKAYERLGPAFHERVRQLGYNPQRAFPPPSSGPSPGSTNHRGATRPSPGQNLPTPAPIERK